MDGGVVEGVAGVEDLVDGADGLGSLIGSVYRVEALIGVGERVV